MRRRRAFTLIEMMLVMLLISLTAGVVVFGAFRALNQDRFLASVRRVVDRLQLAQDLMLLSGTDRPGLDVYLNFFVEDGEWVCKIGFKGDLTGADVRIFGATVRLPEVGDILWGQPDGTWRPLEELAFRTLKDEIPMGVVAVRSRTGNLQRYLLLRGYPARIASQLREPPMPSLTDLERESEELYPQEILQDA